MAKILVAEDDVAVREFVRRALTYRGHAVTAVDDGNQALESLGDAEYDLLLTDIVMPGMDGIALALRVTQERPEMPILLMTGYAAERQRAHKLEALTHRVISKPFSLKEISAAVEEALSSAAGPSGSATTGRRPN